MNAPRATGDSPPKSLALVQPSVLRFPHPVLPARQLGRGRIHSFSILDQGYVLFRDGDGKAVALRDACPHRGAPLSRGRISAQGELVCGYHGWRIRSDGLATSAAVPAKNCRAATLKTWERHGYIWVAHEDVSDAALPDFIEPAHELISAFSTRFDAPLRVVVDNFSEIEHAFTIHRFIGPSVQDLDSVQFSAHSDGERTHATSSACYRFLPFGLGRLFGVRRGDHYHNDWVFQFKPLSGSYRNYWTSEPSGVRRPVSFLVTTFFVPTRGNKAVLHTFLQIAIARSSPLRFLRPLLKLAAKFIVRYEIWADARIARFAPDVVEPEAGEWNLTGLDKQVIVNRRLTDSLYFGQASTSFKPQAKRAAP